MLCCDRNEDENFKDTEIEEDFHKHFDSLLMNILTNIDLTNLLNEILFNSVDGIH